MSDYQENVCQAINSRLKNSNFVPIPKGYVKYLDTEIYYKYYVPDQMYFLIGESQKICLEIVDEIIFIALGVHTLEGFAKFVQNYKIRPSQPHRLLPKSEQRDVFVQEKLSILKQRKARTPYSPKKKSSSMGRTETFSGKKTKRGKKKRKGRIEIWLTKLTSLARGR